MKSKKRSELMALYHHWFPNDKAKGLLLNMHKSVPVQLLDINFIKPIISSYNPYMRYFIKDLLNLVEPTLPISVSNKICQLTELISSPEKFPMISSKIYTVEDINSQDQCVSNDKREPSVEFIDPMEVDTQNNQVSNFGIWRLSSRNCDWSLCPIGGLLYEQ